MTITAKLQEDFDALQLADDTPPLAAIRRKAFTTFNRVGLPTGRNEEWKYTRVSSLFEKAMEASHNTAAAITGKELDKMRLPGQESANELVFVNGIFNQQLSCVRSAGLRIMPLKEACTGEFKNIFEQHFNHSGNYLKDGINALNTAFIDGAVFIYVPRKTFVSAPVYCYNIINSNIDSVLAQPRSLIYLDVASSLEWVELYRSFGNSRSITNKITEIVVEKDANLSCYQVQNDQEPASQVNTTHIRQIGKSVVNSVCISLGGGIIRNNLHAIMEAAYAEAHLYGLYFAGGKSHIDNHTVVDNVAPNCLSNELYKGILDEQSTGVFNGKIFVRPDAQKTNAFQSNKNVLLSDEASINSKPQLEIDADDVKCSHGCTVGSLDREGLFYLQSRGIPYKSAMALLLQGFAMDILEKIKLAPVRGYVEDLIAGRLQTGA